MKVKRLIARSIKDTRKENTIEVVLITEKGRFVASSPNGKSKGKFEAKSWKRSLKGDIKVVNNTHIKDISINSFDDLKLLERVFIKRVGANTMIALEYAFLKALAKQDNKQVWQLINPRARKMPKPIGNIVGGGSHSAGKKPDFQEFQLIPMTNISRAVKINKRAHENCARILKSIDSKFKKKKNDENAWQTRLNNNQIIEVLQNLRDNMKDEFNVKIHLGMDVAASEFYRNKKYSYKNQKSSKTRKQHIEYMQ